jgi:hypothetical protein
VAARPALVTHLGIRAGNGDDAAGRERVERRRPIEGGRLLQLLRLRLTRERGQKDGDEEGSG